MRIFSLSGLTRELLRVNLAPKPFEVFPVIWLDNRHRALSFRIDGSSEDDEMIIANFPQLEAIGLREMMTELRPSPPHEAL